MWSWAARFPFLASISSAIKRVLLTLKWSDSLFHLCPHSWPPTSASSSVSSQVYDTSMLEFYLWLVRKKEEIRIFSAETEKAESKTPDASRSTLCIKRVKPDTWIPWAKALPVAVVGYETIIIPPKPILVETGLLPGDPEDNQWVDFTRVQGGSEVGSGKEEQRTKRKLSRGDGEKSNIESVLAVPDESPT